MPKRIGSPSGRKVPVKLVGGPKNGEFIDYYQPLPQMIVVPLRGETSSHATKFLNYERSGKYEYRFVQ